MPHADIIIIGAGVLGCAISFELAKKGYAVVNIEKNPAAGAGSTSNSCAIVRATYSTYPGVAMAYECFHYWKDWANYVGDHDEQGLARFINCGSVVLKTKGHKWEQILKLYREIGVPHEEWTVAQLVQRIPIYSDKNFYPPTRPEDTAFWNEPSAELSGAVFTPGAGYVNDPILTTHNLQRAAEAHGARFLFGRTVTEVRRDLGRVRGAGFSHAPKVRGVTLDGGEQIDAPVVVNVAGPHSFVVNRLAGVEAGMKIKTRALRHEVHLVPSPAGFDFERDGIHCSDGGSGIYMRPEVGNTILVGSSDPACDMREWITDPDNFNREVTEAQWKAQVYRLAKRIPNLGIPNEKTGFADLYDCADDWIPIYDQSDLPGFYMAVGTSGNQFKNAGPVGYSMAELIDRCERGHDHDREPVVVKQRYTGLDINLGFFSRNREINTQSSFTVSG
ncbi:MAG: NAD(P)/FAD-dependent oxidoreductase [Anaerolineales bacterium]